jgi:potassium channel subfamily K, other eukaryote
MGYDHAEKKELDPSASSSSRSDESREDEILKLEKAPTWQGDGRQDTIASVDNDDERGPPLKHSQTHTLGMLKFRADDDDDPSDWWFASTAIPLIVATFAPMANVLSIAALVVSWRNNLVAEVDGVPTTSATAPDASIGYPDPHWCIALNTASLVCGFVGNLFLLFNFTKRVRYIVALPTTIILFYFSSGILIGITSCIHIYEPPGPGQIYSQGFWHAVIAACLYLFNSMILMVNMLGYFLGHYPQHFTLTDEQRNLILQTMLFFIWLAGGGAVFARVSGWDYPDALYFCDVTILTIGFGDFVATDNLGRGLIFPYSVGGTIILGLMVSSIHKFAGELSKDKVFRQHVETSRVNTLSRAVTMTHEERRFAELEGKFAHLKPGQRPSISAPLPSPPPKDFNDRKIDFEDPAPKEKVDSMGDKLEPTPTQFLTHMSHRGALHRTMQFMMIPVKQLHRVTTTQQKAIIMSEEKDRFDAMRKIQVDARKFKKWYALGMSALAFGLLWCLGAVVFWQCEKHTQGMTYFQGLYFCYVSLLTIGYGDLSPRSNAGKPFFIVWSLIAVPTMTILISDMGNTVISSFKRGTFKLADFTVLPKDGLWRDIMQANPWLFDFLRKRVEKKRIRKGLPVGPASELPDEYGLPRQTIEQLATEKLNEAEMTKRLAFAIRKTADDLRLHYADPVHYTYEEWVEFTRLIRFTKVEKMDDVEYAEETEGVVEWDWLAENSPMLSEQTEAEWVLDRLCESLLRLLKKNNLGLDAHDDPSNASFLPGFGFDNTGRTHARDSEDIDPKSGSAHGEVTPPVPTVTPAQEKRQRAVGADQLLTFFTGERRGENAYVMGNTWSKKALERQKERRRSSTGLKRQGPFAKLVHSGPKGAVGGGRGGAGTKTLKLRHMTLA